MKKGRVLNLSLCASSLLALSCGFSGVAYAQDTDGGEVVGEAAAETILVTGSRIARRDYSAVSPIVTVDAGTIEQAGQGTIEFGLNMLPQMMTGTGSTDVQNRTGRSSLNLRGLGEARSLVLLDGRRIQPATPGGAVDITTIPSAIIQSVEVITGGASAAYGSDAMAGVVNFRLMDNYSGLMAEAKYNFTEDGGGGYKDLTLVGGDNFADGRGNAMLVLSYMDRNQLKRSQREFFRISTTNARIKYMIANLGGNPPSQGAVDSVFGQYGANPGSVRNNVPIGVNDDLTLFTPNPGSGREIINFRGQFDEIVRLDGNRIINNQGYLYDLISPLERFSAFGRVTYDITDNIEWFGQAMFSTFETLNEVPPQTIGTAGTSNTIPVTNPFIPADLRTLLASRNNPNAAFPVTYGFEQLGNQISGADTTSYQIVTGLQGPLGIGDWVWNAYGSHGKTTEATYQKGVFNVRRLQQLLDAPDGGASICDGGLDLFGPHSEVSSECIDYIAAEPHWFLGIEQTNAEATISGSLFKAPGGDVQFALGTNWRREAYSELNDDQAVAGEIPGSTVAPSSSGSRSVVEGFAELLVPILSDVPFFHKLETTLGYRYSDYENAPGVSSYTASVNWQPVDFVTLRGGYSRSIRAPTLEDLFASEFAVSLNLGTPSASSTQGDPCDVRSSFRMGANEAIYRNFCIGLGVPAAAVDAYTLDRQTLYGSASGNPDLRNEKAKSITAGIILESPFSSPVLSGLRLSVDYFDIKITEAIGELPLDAAFARCFNIDAARSNPEYDPNNVNCTFFPRDPDTGLIRRISSRILNLGEMQTRGVDVQLDWRLPLDAFGLGSGILSLHSVGTYLDKFAIQALPGTPTLQFAGFGGRPIIYPKIKALTSLSYQQGPFETTFRWRFAQGVEDESKVANPNSTAPGVGDYHYFDWSARWDVLENTRLSFIVSNLFNKQPYQLGTSAGATDQVTYDVIGRNFTIGISQKF